MRGNTLRGDPLRGDVRRRAAPNGAREAGPSAEEGLEGFDKGLCCEHTAAWQPAQLRGAPGESGRHPPCVRCQPAGSARDEVGSGDGGGLAERVGAFAGAAASGSRGGRGGGGRAGQMLGLHEPGLEFCAGGGGNAAGGSSMRSREGTLTRPLARVRARAAPSDGAATCGSGGGAGSGRAAAVHRSSTGAWQDCVANPSALVDTATSTARRFAQEGANLSL